MKTAVYSWAVPTSAECCGDNTVPMVVNQATMHQCIQNNALWYLQSQGITYPAAAVGLAPAPLHVSALFWQGGECCQALQTPCCALIASVAAASVAVFA